MRKLSANFALEGLVVPVRFLNATVQLLGCKRIFDHVIDSANHHLRTPHAKGEFKNFVLAPDMMRTYVIPTCTPEGAIECLVIVTRDCDRALISQQIYGRCFHAIEILKFID